MIKSQKAENFFAKDIQLKTLERLKKIISGLVAPAGSFWSQYEKTKSYSEASAEQKNNFVRECLKEARSAKIIDIGCNTGLYSKIAADALPGSRVVAIDFDANSIDGLYNANLQWKKNILPLALDITSPSPALGWRLKERKSFLERADFDCALALAVVHHLRVVKNIPLLEIADFFVSLTARHLIVEFVDKNDAMWKRLTAIREDIYDDYSQENFEKTFLRYFLLKKKSPLQMGTRILYFFEKNGA
jgi:ribosomal protein L11 methylase PrmA